ncbi:branched-chain amino acid ABC transporter permease [Specibacter sp. RAF43]|uniref:branched-chain amino acid ABC transporter permease n=1 Tax=Specibacter sp. RAF43 TaxID=3233057 RepID=UPI003F9815ED
MTTLINFIIIGLALGAIYGLLATSMGLILQTTTMLDLGVGAYAAVGGMVAAAVGLPWGILAGIGAAATMALLMGTIFLALQKKGATDSISAAFASIGILFAATSLVLWSFGTNPRHVALLSGNWALGGVSVNRQSVFNIAVALSLVGAVIWIMYKTSLGQTLRASAVSARSAELTGIPVKRVQLSVFAISGALAGIAGVLMVFTRGMSYGLGLTLTIAAFGAMIVFGAKGLIAVFAGGMVIGAVEAMGAGYFPASFASMVPLVFILVILMTGRFKLEVGARP